LSPAHQWLTDAWSAVDNTNRLSGLLQSGLSPVPGTVTGQSALRLQIATDIASGALTARTANLSMEDFATLAAAIGPPPQQRTSYTQSFSPSQSSVTAAGAGPATLANLS